MFAAVCKSLLVILGLLSPAFAQTRGDVVSLPFSPAPYRVGERLTYNVTFSSFVSAAHVELQVVARGPFQGREAIQLRGHVETTGVVNVALFAINNDYVTYVDPETGLPFHSQQATRAATRSSDSARDFNQPAGVAAIPGKSRSGSLGTYDFLSAIYRLRALPLSEGSTYYITVRGENEDYQAELKVSGRETIRTNVGSFNTLASQIRIANNSQANNYRIRVFFSDDERHVPVLITARLSAGELRAELAGSEFIKPAVPTPPPIAAKPPTGPAAAPPLSIPSNSEEGDGALDSLPFKVGEQLNYQVFLGTMPQPAGTATFHVRSRSRFFDRDGLLFAAQAQTSNAAQKLFLVNDQVTTYVDPKTLLPFRVEMSLTEGKRRLNQILSINQDHGAVTSDKGQRIEIPVGTHDYLSFFYLGRTFNLTPPKRNAVSILVNNKPRTLIITSLKRETIQIGSQNIPAIMVSLTTDDPQPDKFQLRAWISDDKRHLPLRLEAVTEIGAVRAELAIIPLTSQ